jgi:hypothetical protein
VGINDEGGDGNNDNEGSDGSVIGDKFGDV